MNHDEARDLEIISLFEAIDHTYSTLVMTNIAMENPGNQWRFLWENHLFPWAIVHGYVSHNQRVTIFKTRPGIKKYQHNYGKSPFLMGKSSINGPFSMYQKISTTWTNQAELGLPARLHGEPATRIYGLSDLLLQQHSLRIC